MTPEEKAKELVYKFYDEIKYIETAKQCALIAVIEFIIQGHPFGAKDYTDYIKNGDSYWHKVKHEIEKL